MTSEIAIWKVSVINIPVVSFDKTPFHKLAVECSGTSITIKFVVDKCGADLS